MTGTDESTRLSRRTVLRATALAGIGLAGAGVSDARARTASGGRTASRARTERVTQTDPFEGYACGPGYAEGDTFAVTPRCGDDCEVIRATGLAPDCSGGDEALHVDLPGTDPVVWVATDDRRTGAIRPGRYRVVGVEACGGDAPACADEELHRVRFRELDSDSD
ncbi:hypothetical protein [Halorussus amylolyticus]|uniref:hypothetical protein n=1 Tax=Halorussus amylolyticus TaxID=1126242 RepID=UPI00138F5EB9|nr:hypothetical protein [Halorussus amylolyticus]